MADNYLNALLVDDDSDFTDDFSILLPDGMRCDSVTNVDDAFDFLKDNRVDVIFLDIDLGTGTNGLDFLKALKTDDPYMPVIMITADQKVDSVVKAIHLGASDYIGKSPDLSALKLSISRAITENQLQQRFDLLNAELEQKVGDLVGESQVMREIKNKVKKLSQVSSSVLITGPSGSGKELVARCIHRMSLRCNKPFIAVNCAALTRELIESELFGHEKGSFTGAFTRHIGKFEIVDGGTLFLDEITEIPVEIQAKFLRVLQENEFERVGGNRLLNFEGRVLASSNRDIEQEVKKGRLREDLLFRLDVTRLQLPPLLERKDDIPLLVDYFVKMKSDDMKKKVSGLTEQAIDLFRRYEWPGNVRELANYIESALVHTENGILDIGDFERLSEQPDLIPENYDEAKKKFLGNFQRKYISAILNRNGGNLSLTAEMMGVSRQGLAKMMKTCGLSYQDD